MALDAYERFTGVNETRVIQVIEIKSYAGNGTHKSPGHEVTEYYSFDGELLARHSYKDKLERGHFFADDKLTIRREDDNV